MGNFRTYGRAPFNIGVIHGGPGAGGEMEPVAVGLKDAAGILEPFQTQLTLKGQVDELCLLLERHANLPVVLIGFSWGAWLSYILAAKCPILLKKLILVGSGPYQECYVERIQQTRLQRLRQEEQTEYKNIIILLNQPDATGKDEKFARLGQLAAKTDQYDPIEVERSWPPDGDGNKGNAYHQVLREAQDMRADGSLIALADQIRCPVTALHGDYDPHPAEGVFEPLSKRLRDFRFIRIERCGHKPWIERQAKESFFSVLRNELLGS